MRGHFIWCAPYCIQGKKKFQHICTVWSEKDNGNCSTYYYWIPVILFKFGCTWYFYWYQWKYLNHIKNTRIYIFFFFTFLWRFWRGKPRVGHSPWRPARHLTPSPGPASHPTQRMRQTIGTLTASASTNGHGHLQTRQLIPKLTARASQHVLRVGTFTVQCMLHKQGLLCANNVHILLWQQSLNFSIA